jgi:hypothetical protein
MNVVGSPREHTTKAMHSHNIRQVLRKLDHTGIANCVRCDYASDTMVGFVYEGMEKQEPWDFKTRRFLQADVPRAGYSVLPDYELAAAMLLVQL